MIRLVSAAALCVLSAAAGLAAANPVGEPDWEVFHEAVDRTPQPVAAAMLKLASVNAKDVVFDLGCGDGVIVVTAAKKYGARAVGIDINPKMVARAKANAEKDGVADKTTFVEGDLYKADLKSATVITLFLWRAMNVRLRPRLLDLAPGTRIVSHEHDMGGWRPDRSVHVQHREWGRRRLLLWVVPAKVAGTWQVRAGGGEFSLKLKQNYQRFHGTAVADGRTWRIRNGWIDGAKVTFDLTAADGRRKHYIGTVTPDGAIDGDGWRATRSM